MTMHRYKDISGSRFGRWLVLAWSYTGSDRRSRRLCQCDCGGKKVVSIRMLTNGQSQSCGCLGLERRVKAANEALTTHGQTIGGVSRTYRIWTNMLSRCGNPNFTSYEWYGARGIKVCERWKKFDYFLADMGEAPDELTIDRIDNDGNYEPGNCRWATRKEQAQNKHRALAA